MTSPRRILLLGSNGQLGWELSRALAPLGDVVAMTRANCDLTDEIALKAAVVQASPDIIVNAAAYTAVDRAEGEPELAHQVNAMAPGMLARLSAEHGLRLVHFSTDYVFDGEDDAPHAEESATRPLSVYGASKLAGEQAIAASGSTHWIFRTSWLFGMQGVNFVKTILHLAAEREELRVVCDQIGAPTPAALLADLTAHALHAETLGLAMPDGIYHACAAGPVSWHAFACAIVEEAMAAGMPLRLTSGAIAAIPGSAYPLPARRPLNSRLNCAKLEFSLGLRMPSWRPYLKQMIEFLGKTS